MTKEFMTNLVVISNDQRVAQLIAHAQPLVQGKIVLADNFDLGMAYVFEKHPAAVYIQGNINGTSCEKVVRHIKNMLQTSAPKLVLLYDSASGKSSDPVNVDGKIDLARTDTEFISSFLDQVTGSVTVFTSPAPPMAAASAPSGPQESGAPHDRPEGTAPEGTVPPRAKIDHTIPTQCYLIGVVNDDVTVKPATTVRNISRYTVGLALLVAIGSGSYYLFHGADPPVWYKKAVSSWSHKPVTAREMTGSQSPPLIRQLPASIRTAKPDPSFTASAPGWERYSSDTKEFRVFREQGAIRAIQVIALKGNILTDSFFKEFLREICREEPRAATQHSTENGYELENGALPCGAQFTTYRKHGNSSMIAFVVSLP